MTGNENDDNRYEQWLDYVAEFEVMTGKTDGYQEYLESTKLEIDLSVVAENVSKKEVELIKDLKTAEKPKRKYSENEDDEDDELEEDEDGNVIRNDEDLLLDDEFDDTFGEMPDDYIQQLANINGMDKESELQEKIEVKEEEPEDEWGF
jgi:hypothetical protein